MARKRRVELHRGQLGASRSKIRAGAAESMASADIANESMVSGRNGRAPQAKGFAITGHQAAGFQITQL